MIVAQANRTSRFGHKGWTSMKKIVSVMEQYEITGEWSLKGSHYSFRGKVTKINDSNFSHPLNYDIPVGAMKRFGLKMMEDDIEISAISEIKSDWNGHGQNVGLDLGGDGEFKLFQPNIFSWFTAMFRRNHY